MPETTLNSTKCYKAHNSKATRDAVSHIPQSQKSFSRHKRAACAYEAGLAAGREQAMAEARAERTSR